MVAYVLRTGYLSSQVRLLDQAQTVPSQSWYGIFPLSVMGLHLTVNLPVVLAVGRASYSA